MRDQNIERRTSQHQIIDQLRKESFGIELRPQEQSPILEARDFFDMTGTVVLMGGTFDPFHVGHLATGMAVRNHLASKLGVDDNDSFSEIKFVFMPAHQNPDKPDPPIASDEHRLRMIVESIRPYPGMFVCPIELKECWDPVWSAGDQKSYTVTTIEILDRLLDSSANLYFTIGAEYASNLQHWHGIDRIMKCATIAIEFRAGYEQAATLVGPRAEGSLSERSKILGLTETQVDKLDKNTVWVPSIEISATRLRGALKEYKFDGETPEIVRQMLPYGGLRYIEDNSAVYSW